MARKALPEVGAATGLGFARLTYADGASASARRWTDRAAADWFLAGSFADLVARPAC